MVVFLASSPRGAPAICVIAKRAYSIAASGAVERDEAGAFRAQAEAHDDPLFPLLEHDLELWPTKLATDIVVKGAVYGSSRGSARRTVTVAVGGFRRSVAVFGNRRVVRTSGWFRFGDPEPFDRMELTLRRAYGGVDCSVAVPPAKSEVHAKLRPFIQEHPGMYPRNPGGVGYAVNEEWLGGLVLPNFEDPKRLLTEDNIVVGRPDDWWKMPLPQGFGWFPPHCFPRNVHFGNVPEFAPPDDLERVEEMRLGLVSSGQCAALNEATDVDWRGMNGACPGMQVSAIEGNEDVELDGFCRAGALRFSLPASDRPEFRVRHRAKDLAVTRRLHTLLIEPDLRRFSMVWGGMADAPEELPERIPTIMGEASEWDLLEGVDVTVDGAECPRLLVPLPRLPRAPWEMG